MGRHRTYRVAAHFDPNKALGGGYASRTVLWHLMDEGVADAVKLAKLSGCLVTTINQACHRMAKTGMLQWAPQQVTPVKTSRHVAYALTPIGIEAALQIDAKDVEFADPEPEAQAA